MGITCHRGMPQACGPAPHSVHDFLRDTLRSGHRMRLALIYGRPLIALGLILLSVPILFGFTRGLVEAVLIAPVLGAVAYYVLLRDWD